MKQELKPITVELLKTYFACDTALAAFKEEYGTNGTVYLRDLLTKCIEINKPHWYRFLIYNTRLHSDYIEQTNEICLEAVKQYGYALKYVKEQTNEICLEAVKQYGDALKYVKEQTNETD